MRGELVTTAMVRARFCELLAEAAGRRREGGALFMAGLFSLLDALMRMRMVDVIERLDLTPELRGVLLAREGPYASVLGLAEAYETGRWDEVFTGAADLGVPLDDLSERYAQAVEWARERVTETAA